MRLLALLFVALAVRAGAQVVQGTPESDLLARKGAPVTRVASGNRVIYGWPDMQVTVVDGVVAKVSYKDAATEAAEQARRAKLEADAQKGRIEKAGGPTDPLLRARADFERAQARKRLWARSFLGQPAPALVVDKWLGEVPLANDGKFKLVDFWATWCPPCRESIPELNAIRRQFGNQLDVIGISDESEEAVRRMVDPAIQYYVAIDPQARTKKAVGVQGIPHVLLIDPAGVVRWEGFPLLEGARLTPDVVQTVLRLYAK